jgi:hypothetical protein
MLGWTEESTLGPTPVTITGIRIPADGSPAHLLSLTTINTAGTAGGMDLDYFLLHIPDLREYWTPEHAWESRNLHRLDLHQENSSQRERYLEQQIELWKHYYLQRSTGRLSYEQLLRHRQQLYCPQEHRFIQEPYLSCIGTYYVFWSFDFDGLPENIHVPPWIRGDYSYIYSGDVFIVKVGSQGHDDGATYEDIIPDFLHLLSNTAS